jgi:uncharacterized membrane protein
MSLLPLLLCLHIAAVTLWVGGMFFAYVCLRPVAALQLEPPVRLRLWRAVLARFFPWVWVAVTVLLGSGLLMISAVGMKAAPVHWHLMLSAGLIMMSIFLHVFFAPYKRLARAVDASDWPAAGAALAQIRTLVGFNMALGFATVAIATLGRWLVAG